MFGNLGLARLEQARGSCKLLPTMDSTSCYKAGYKKLSGQVLGEGSFVGSGSAEQRT